MKKKSKKNLKYLDLGIVALAVIALIMIFLPAVGAEEDAWNGLKVVFGYKEETKILTSTVTTEILGFSFMNLLTYIFVILAAVCAGMNFKKKGNKLLLLSVLFSLLAGAFFLLTKNFVVLNDSLVKVYEALGTTFAKEAELGAGPIIGAICMFLAAIVGGAKVFLDK